MSLRNHMHQPDWWGAISSERESAEFSRQALLGNALRRSPPADLGAITTEPCCHHIPLMAHDDGRLATQRSRAHLPGHQLAMERRDWRQTPTLARALPARSRENGHTHTGDAFTCINVALAEAPLPAVWGQPTDTRHPTNTPESLCPGCGPLRTRQLLSAPLARRPPFRRRRTSNTSFRTPFQPLWPTPPRRKPFCTAGHPPPPLSGVALRTSVDRLGTYATNGFPSLPPQAHHGISKGGLVIDLAASRGENNEGGGRGGGRLHYPQARGRQDLRRDRCGRDLSRARR